MYGYQVKINGLPQNEMKLIKNHNMSTTLLTLFKLHNITLLTIDPMLYERSLELIFFLRAQGISESIRYIYYLNCSDKVFTGLYICPSS